MQLQRFQVSNPIDGRLGGLFTHVGWQEPDCCEIPSQEDPYGVNISTEDQIRVRCIASGLRPAVLRRKTKQTDEQPATSLEQMWTEFEMIIERQRVSICWTRPHDHDGCKKWKWWWNIYGLLYGDSKKKIEWFTRSGNCVLGWQKATSSSRRSEVPSLRGFATGFGSRFHFQ